MAIILTVSAVTGYFDHIGDDYTDKAMKRALISFAAARGLNGIISVAQGTEIAIHPAGFGLNFTPGQVLDPINDLVEQFSWVMLMSAASIGIQKVFLNISSSLVATALLVFLLFVAVLLAWKPHKVTDTTKRRLFTLAMMLVFIRFSVPVSVIGGEVLYQWFLSDQYATSSKELERSSETIGELNKELAVQDSTTNSLLDKAKQIMSSAARSLDYQAKFAQYQAIASEMSLHVVNLIVVFISQTVIFPLLFLWFLYQALKLLVQRIVVQRIIV